jgi:hypothetical protein
MVTDAVIRQLLDPSGPGGESVYTYSEVVGAAKKFGVYNRSNHLDRTGRATGGNIIFADGHGDWRDLDDMQVRISGSIEHLW